MGIRSELETSVKKIFSDQWTIRDGTVVPDDDSVTLGNDGVNIAATVLYADLSDSTGLVDKKVAWFAADVYKSYLLCAAKIIRAEGGVITAFDGDRVMAIYIGDRKNSKAVRTALKLNWAVEHIINPAVEHRFGVGTYTVEQVVGIDTSSLLAAKTGIRNANDLVWVGRAANHAAKLCGRKGFTTFATTSVYNSLPSDLKISVGKNIWTYSGGKDVVGTNYWMPLT
ncbi:MAG: adenylate/guanylate cyclase domain-containing protein [Proteobacteria bacterium]|nr:MAG: adenylate/guanylate cyclase domain-containing protein [Pseudomonadota bacterium]